MSTNKASNAVYDYIVSNIRNGSYLPETRIDTEEGLCQILGVSRIAVRQAIDQLYALGVLKKIQGSGTYVSRFEDASLAGMAFYPPNADRLLSLLEFRQQFASGNISLFVKNATEEEKTILAENYHAMCMSVGDTEQFVFLEKEFHRLITSGTHNIIAIQMYELLTDILKNYYELQYRNVGPDNCIKWHGRIVEAINNNDVDMARLCIAADIGNSIEIVKKNIE